MSNQYIKSISTSADREDNDNYATSPDATRLLLRHEEFYSKILEPCCGQGCISSVLLEKGYEVISSDLYNYGYGEVGIDFLDEGNSFINDLKGQVDIVTNCPYKLTAPMLKRALDVCRNKVCMLFPLNYLTRFYFCPPTRIYVFTRRIDIAKGGDFSTYQHCNMKDFCWMVWIKGYKGDTVVKYIVNNKKVLPQIKEMETEFADKSKYWNLTKEDKKARIRELFEKDGLSKREIARIVGVSEGAVRKWLKQSDIT